MMTFYQSSVFSFWSERIGRWSHQGNTDSFASNRAKCLGQLRRPMRRFPCLASMVRLCSHHQHHLVSHRRGLGNFPRAPTRLWLMMTLHATFSKLQNPRSLWYFRLGRLVARAIVCLIAQRCDACWIRLEWQIASDHRYAWTIASLNATKRLHNCCGTSLPRSSSFHQLALGTTWSH